jgi:hypothetical protein
MEKKIKQRYDKNDPLYNEYFRVFDDRYSHSEILSPANGRLTDKGRTLHWSEDVIRRQIVEIKSYINARGEDLKKIDFQINEAFLRAVGEGKKPPIKEADETWPKDLLMKRLSLEARCDVYLRELYELEAWLTNEQEKKKLEINDNFLKTDNHGDILLFGHFWGFQCPPNQPELMNVLKTYAGQEVRLHDNLLIVEDQRSPYNGMAVYDFTSMVHSYENAKRKLRGYLDAIARRHTNGIEPDSVQLEEIKQKQDIAKENFFTDNPELAKILSNTINFHGKTLPGIPEGTINYLEVAKNKKKVKETV